jgi:hypothetical protein
MTITIHSTTKIVNLNGLPCRIWEGVSARGLRVHCFIPQIAVDADADTSEFQKELEEHEAPSVHLPEYPAGLERSFRHN